MSEHCGEDCSCAVKVRSLENRLDVATLDKIRKLKRAPSTQFDGRDCLYLMLVVSGKEQASNEDVAHFGRFIDYLIDERLVGHAALAPPISLPLSPSEERPEGRVALLWYVFSDYTREELNQKLGCDCFVLEGEIYDGPWPVWEKEKEEVYIPENLEDAFKELDRLTSEEDREKLKAGKLQLVDTHFGAGMWVRNNFGAGMWVRNNWGLWSGSRLSTYFNGLGISHPDDMSGIILDSYLRYLKDEPIRLEEQVAHYQEYWKGNKDGDKEENPTTAEEESDEGVT